MKKIPFFSLLTVAIVFFALVLSCTKTREDISLPSTNKADNSYRTATPVDSINYDSTGSFVYNHIKKHLLYYDPYDLMPKEGREELKHKVDSVQSAPGKEEGFHWDEASKRNIISKLTGSILKDIEKELKKNITDGYDREQTIKWFDSKIVSVKTNNGLKLKDKHIAVRHLTMLKYTLKAAYESLTISDKSGRTNSTNACTVPLLNCIVTNASTYAAIGAVFGTDAGAVVGVFIGSLLSISTCTCGSSCTFPAAVSTPDVCYDPYNGIKFKVSGYGTNALGFRIELYKSDNLITANQIAFKQVSSGDEVTFSNSDLVGNDLVYVSVYTNCGGQWLNQPKVVAIRISQLGWPDFTIAGPANPYITSYVSYNMVGRNLSDVSWSLYTRNQASGTINSSYLHNTTTWIQWNQYPGWVVVAGEAHTSCGACYRQMDVYTHN